MDSSLSGNIQLKNSAAEGCRNEEKKRGRRCWYTEHTTTRIAKYGYKT
jgi:hypothetical protein